MHHDICKKKLFRQKSHKNVCPLKIIDFEVQYNYDSILLMKKVFGWSYIAYSLLNHTGHSSQSIHNVGYYCELHYFISLVVSFFIVMFIVLANNTDSFP